MRLKPKLLNAIILGLTMFLSMQTTCAACNPSMAIQQKKVATVGKKRVAISKKRVVKSKKRTYRKASARKYSHRELKGQWKFSGDKHKSLQVDTERTFHQRYPLVML